MSPTPSRTIPPEFISDLECPICGQDALRVHQMERFPDYVACDNCESQFVLEDAGERVMYGKIPAAYPRTRRFALQQWAWPEAVARRAADERPEPLDLPASATAPPPVVEEPPPEPQEVAPPPTPTPQPPEEAPQAEAETAADIFEEPAPEETAERLEPTEEEMPPPADLFEETASEPPVASDEEELEGPEAPVLDETEEPGWMAEADPAEPEEIGSAPPFGSAPADRQPEDDFPSEAEPAPEMPDWLRASSPEAQDDVSPAADEPAADPGPSFVDEPGMEEDLTAALWDEAPPSEEPAPESLDQPQWMAEPASEAEGDLAAESDEDDLSDLFDEEHEVIPDLGAGDSVEGWEGSADEDEGLAAGLPPSDEGLSQAEVAEMLWTGQVAQQGGEETEMAAAGLGAAAVEEITEDGVADREPTEPPPGDRYRVVLQGGEARFPTELCAHCGRTPVAGSLSVTATVYQGSGLGERKVKSFRIPVCAECRQRASARSEEQQTARIQAHLVSVLVGLVMVVGGLAFRLVDFQGAILFDLSILLLLGGMGYLVPAVFLLVRASRFSKPEDATFVASTLRVPADTEGVETAFEWRNPTYARLFLNANQGIAASGVSKIRERSYEG